MATATKPDRLHFTGDDDADRLIARDPFALLVGFALDQQVPVQSAFSGPLKLKQRLGTLDPGKVAATDPGKLEAIFREKPAIHRFPGNMAKRVQELAAVVSTEYGGAAERVWTEADNGDELRRRIAGLPGFGEMKIKAFSAVLAKPFDVVRRKTPRSRVTFEYSDESDQVGYPIPKGVHIEGGSDHHVLLVDRSACRLYELG